LQRRSLFLVLLRRDSSSRLEENEMTTPTGPPACARQMSASVKTKSNPDLDSRGKSLQIGFSWAAHIVARPIRFGQQGRLQRRSLFLVLLRRDSSSRLEENEMTTPTGPPACARQMSASVKKKIEPRS
jgi:hypothetical protein